jgi:hypothetical protein
MKIILSSLLIFVSHFAIAQKDTLYYTYNFETKVINGSRDTLLNPWAGGLNQPQFSMTDLNGDGKKDLVLFDRAGSKTLTFIAYLDKTNTIQYSYDPQYERLFPKSDDIMVLIDYNKDGLEDCYYRDPFDGYVKYAQNNGNGFNITEGFLKAYNFGQLPFDSSNFVLWQGNYPAITDVDLDGDIDFLSTDYCGTDIIFNLNNQTENNLDQSLISYEIPDRCFGSLGESTNGIITGAKCYYNRYYRYKKKHCASKTLAFYDIDGDGDKDLFLGTSEDANNSVLLIINGKTEFDLKRDSFIRIDTSFFTLQERALMPIAPAVFFLDMDKDGLIDMVISANETRKADYVVHETNQIMFFKNTRSNALPKFEYQTNKYLIGNMIDEGSLSQPVLYDTDNDGDLDLIMASNGDSYITKDQHDRLTHYENIGTKKTPIFKQTTNNLWNLSNDSLIGIHICFGDLNGDNKDEMLVGTTNGELALYENISNKETPQFRLISREAFGLFISTNTAPQLVDVNRDGKNDLLVGVREGNIYYFENVGSKISAAFVLKTDSFGKININELIVPDPPRYNSIGYNVPQLTDLDNDGKYDLLVGGLEGVFRIYRNVEDNINGEFQLTDSVIFGQNEFYNKDLGSRVRPFAADLNGDSIAEIIVGNSRGGLNYFKGNLTKNGSVGFSQTMRNSTLRIYPNPSNGQITINGIDKNAEELVITNNNGQSLHNQPLNANTPTIRLNLLLSSGVYFIKITGKNYQSTGKLVLLQE